ncbi:MAG TPA: histidine phosphatase family protein [Vicinamibacterales bacterium]|nr:histidine phosphatase family protein [Vicinamibacterales bacterium]
MIDRRRLFLIRHADPEIVANVASADWHLSGRGLERAKTLASTIRPVAVQQIYSSVERKAMQTAEVFGAIFRVPIMPVPGLHEHDRKGTALLPADVFHKTMRSFFSQPAVCVFGNESADEARTRFERALLPLVQDGIGDIVVVTHGTVLTLAVAERCKLDPFHFWQRLGLPSAVSLTVPDMTLEQVTSVN